MTLESFYVSNAKNMIEVIFRTLISFTLYSQRGIFGQFCSRCVNEISRTGKVEASQN